MTKISRSVVTGIMLLSAFAQPLAAAPSREAKANAQADRPDVSVTRHSVTLRGGRKMNYTARAGFLPLVNDATRELTANIFFVAYTADQPASAKPRPITFIFPGGPGATATLSNSAPHIVQVTDGKARVVDNPDTLLAASDVVLVDPVGSGYSRMTKPEYKSLFYSTLGDRDALVEAVRLYIQRYDPAESPIFLSGGSWGSVRSMLVADAAIKRNIPIRGIMVSAEGASLSLIGSDVYYSTLVPGFTVIAQAHKKLPPDLQGDRAKAIAEAKQWAADRYLPALTRGNTLSPEDRHIIAVEMSRYSGLKPEVIEKHDLKIGAELFVNELLRDEGKSVGFYDTRIAGPAQSGAYDATKDPSLMAKGNAYPSLAERYLLRRELGVVTDDYYAGPFGGGWPVRPGVEDWMAIKWGMSLDQAPTDGTLAMVLPTFESLVEQGIPALIGEGYYDWASSPFGVDYVASRVPSRLKDRVTVRHYESGHTVPAAEFNRDAAAFIEAVLREPPPATFTSPSHE